MLLDLASEITSEIEIASEITSEIEIASEVTSEITSGIALRSLGSGLSALADALVEAICPLPSPG